MKRRWLVLWVLAAGCRKDAPPAPAPLPAAAHVLGATPRPQPGLDAAVAARAVDAGRPDQATIAAGTKALDAERNAGILAVLSKSNKGAFADLATGDLKGAFDDKDILGGLTGDPISSGGFGLKGSGVGGGTGFGSIGTGRYGTIGRGGQTSSGYGVGGGRLHHGPTAQVSLGTPGGVPPTDRDAVQRMFRRNLPRLQYCFEKQLLVSPDLAGTVAVDFTITATGAVQGVKASGLDRTVAKCIADAVGAMSFPAPTATPPLSVHYPISFHLK